ncbi:MAG: membrane protein insertase YidC [Chlamydiia bacterium]|nr:membrane protein insertase YidC [Chlamydiia bacterium]
MNKRFLIFVLSMSTILFFVNQYFTAQKQKEYDAHQKEHQISSEERARTNQSDVQKRTASLQNLPLFRAYTDQNNENLFSWATLCGRGSYLLAAGNEKWVDTLYVNGEKVELVATDDRYALYSSSSQTEIISTYLPLVGMHDVQIVSFENDLNPQIMLGEFDEGQLFFPLSIPSQNGIVLYEVDDTYLPVGVYEKRSSSYFPIAKLSHFNSYITYKVETFPQEPLSDQEYFVLENETMQVVFSNLGGAIAEINLPFKDKEEQESVVLPVGFDRIIEKKYPSNSRFPSHSYTIVPKGASQPVKNGPTLGGYYPLLRRGIEKNSGYPPYRIPPQYYAFNIISEDPETAQTFYKLTHFDNKMIQFEATFPNRRIIKTYSFPKEGNDAPYCLDVSVKVEGDSRGLWVSSGIPEVELISGSPAPMIKYSTVQNHKHVVEKLSLPKTSTTMSSFQPNWVSNSNGYFTLIIDPLTEVGAGFQANHIPGNLDPSRIAIIDSTHDLYPANKYPGYDVHVPLKRSSQPMNFRFYAGPLEKEILQKVDNTYTNPVTGYNPNYTQTRSFHGWFSFISEPFAKFLYFIMSLFYSATGSWGISIILLTVVLRIMMYPLNAWSIKSTLKMQELSPKLEKMKEKQKKAKDPKQAQMEMMAFYKENKINPLGGCLPLIIQMPFLFGMFDLLKSAFPLRGASFIPGWIDNLTAPDVVFSWGYPIPFIGTSLHALPILLGVVMYFQQKLGQAQNKKKGPLTEQQQQQQKMGMIMTLIFPLLFYKFPSGLNLYWLSSMALQILQQWYMSKRQKPNKNSREILVKPKKK